jgi:hypothetical protein
MRIGRFHAESGGSADKRRNLCKARKTPYQFALAIASFGIRGNQRLSTAVTTWRKFRENIQKLMRRDQNQDLNAQLGAQWVDDFLGAPEAFGLVFDLSSKDHLSFNPGVLGRRDIEFIVRDAAGNDLSSTTDVVAVLERQLSVVVKGPASRRCEVDLMEPDPATRELMYRTAQAGLGLSKLHEVDELVLGKALYLSKIAEAPIFVAVVKRQLDALMDDLKKESSAQDLADHFGNFHALRREATSLCPYVGDPNPLLDLCEGLADLTDALLARAIKPSEVERRSKMGIQTDPQGNADEGLFRVINEVTSRCNIAHTLNRRVDDCKEKLKAYLGAISSRR